jgi:TolB-like protein/DNA-binding winged helix-turn-helix (wHTH) protein/tetratricopeptide (TPR) repeat protein
MSADHRHTRLRFGVFELDPASGELRRQGARVRLQEKSLQVLLALLERPGELVTRHELQRRLWPDDTFVEFDNNLNNTVSRLREALRDTAENPRFVETIPRRGYRFIAPVAPASAEPPAVAVSEPSAIGAAETVPISTSIPEPRPRQWLVGVIAAASLVTALAALWMMRPATRSTAVAVLPFVSGGAVEGSTADYLAFGMTDALIGELSRIGALRVISQTSAMQYKGVRKPLPVIARELGADTIVEGSVVHEGDQVRITVQLIDARSDTHLWTQTYSRDSETALSTQRALASEVARLIRSRLVPADHSPATALRPTSAQAYEAYVKGRYFMQQPGEASMARARGLFEQAIAADPAFAPAHVGLATYYLFTDTIAPAEAIPRAETSARRALELDETSAAAHAALAFVHYFGHWDWTAAEREFTRAIALDPNDAWSRRWHAMYLSAMGRHSAAIPEIQRAIELDPISIASFDAAGGIWANARRFDMVLEQARRIHDLSATDPRGFMHFASGYLHQGRFAEAVEWAQKGLEASGRNPAFLCVLSVAQQRAGQTESAQKTMAEIDRVAAQGYVPDTFLAVSYLWLRDHDSAVRQLQRAYDRRDGYLVVANVAPWLEPLHNHPKFQELLWRMKFPKPVAEPAP